MDGEKVTKADWRRSLDWDVVLSLVEDCCCALALSRRLEDDFMEARVLLIRFLSLIRKEDEPSSASSSEAGISSNWT